MPRQFFVYLMTDHRNGTFYAGVTSDLVQRCHQHRTGTGSEFTSEHGLRHLAWYETHATFETAVHREKQIKRWRRKWKLELIEGLNPGWRDLAFSLGGAPINDCPPIPSDDGSAVPDPGSRPG